MVIEGQMSVEVLMEIAFGGVAALNTVTVMIGKVYDSKGKRTGRE